MSKISIVGLVGESVFLSVDTLPQGGETVEAKEMFCELGGKGFNQALAAARFGASVSFLTAVGKDGYKEKVEAFCEKEGIKPTIIEKQGKTAYAVIHTEKSGENVVSVYRGAQLATKDIDIFEGEIADSDYLLLTNEIPKDVLIKAIELAEKYNVKVVFNPAPQRFLEEEIKDKIYLFTPNEHEIKGLENRENVIITLGKKGVYIKNMKETLPALSVNAVDTTGAGDTFNGVLVSMLSQDKDIKSAVKTAILASGKSVTKKGAATSVPYIKDIKGE